MDHCTALIGECFLFRVTWNILIFNIRGRLERLGIDIQELVQRAPSVNEEHAWTGAKTARMFLLDLDSGMMVRELSTNGWATEWGWPSNTLLVGRSDYSLQGTDRFSRNKEVIRVDLKIVDYYSHFVFQSNFGI
jgi:hypothetical protein